MAFDDLFRLSAHAVITSPGDRILLLKANYGSRGWGLPGGALEPGETIHECIARECREELSQDIAIRHLTGVYYHKAYNSQVFIFRCDLPAPERIVLSAEHSEYRYFSLDELSPVQRTRAEACLNFRGVVASAKF